MSYSNLGIVLAALGQPEKAEAAICRAIDLRQRLVADFPAVPTYRHELAMTHNNMGIVLNSLGKRGESEAAYRQALEILAKLAADFSTVPEYRKELARSHLNLGALLADLEKRAEAAAAYRQALDIQVELVARFPEVPEYRKEQARSHDNLGTLLDSEGKRDEAAAAYRQALDVREKLAADFPNVPAYAVELAGGCCNFGHLLCEGGQAVTALNWYQKAIATLESVVANEPRLVPAREFLRNSHWGRAKALDALGRHAEAAQDWKRALAMDDGSMQDEIRANFARSRLWVFQKNKDAAGCVAAAAEWEALKRSDTVWLYGAACNRAICAAVIKEDPKTPAADAVRLAKEQGELAMAWLHKAVAAGYKNVEHLKKNKELDALRDREDFKNLLADVEAKTKP